MLSVDWLSMYCWATDESVQCRCRCMSSSWIAGQLVADCVCMCAYRPWRQSSTQHNFSLAHKFTGRSLQWASLRSICRNPLEIQTQNKNHCGNKSIGTIERLSLIHPIYNNMVHTYVVRLVFFFFLVILFFFLMDITVVNWWVGNTVFLLQIGCFWYTKGNLRVSRIIKWFVCLYVARIKTLL